MQTFVGDFTLDYEISDRHLPLKKGLGGYCCTTDLLIFVFENLLILKHNLQNTIE